MKNLLLILLTTTIMNTVCFAEEVLWLMDGSAVVFDDTVKIENIETPGMIPMLKDHYEGMFQEEFPIGAMDIEVESDDYPSAEAEWVLISPQGFPEDVTEDDSFILQGMIEGKYFGKFLKNQKKWGPASANNNLIAEGPGIETTFKDLKEGTVNSKMIVKYIDARGKKQVFTSDSDALKKVPVMALVREIVKRHPGKTITHINMGAIGTKSGFANDKKIMVKAALKSLFKKKGDGFKYKVLYEMSKEVKKKKKYVDSSVTISVFNEEKEEVGNGVLNFVIAD
jgi:hypothetical protein